MDIGSLRKTYDALLGQKAVSNSRKMWQIICARSCGLPFQAKIKFSI